MHETASDYILYPERADRHSSEPALDFNCQKDLNEVRSSRTAIMIMSSVAKIKRASWTLLGVRGST